MPRLGRLPPRVATIPAKLVTATVDDESWRSASAPWRKWYKTRRWQELRLRTIWRDRAACARCGIQHNAAATFIAATGPSPGKQELAILQGIIKASPTTWVADHIDPHRGDEAMFWDGGGLQCLCKPCHDRDKQREEARARRR